MDIVYILLILTAIIVLGILSKRLNIQSSLILILGGILVYIFLSKASFYACGIGVAFYYLIAMLLRFYSKSLYEKAFEFYPKNGLPLLAYGGLLFAIILVYVLNKSTYDDMDYNFNFLRLAFFTCYASGLSLAVSQIVNGFSKYAINISTNKKTLPFEIGSVTIIGALASFVCSFAVGIFVYYECANVIWAIICAIISFIGYLANALIMDKFQTRPKLVTVENGEGENVEKTVVYEKNYQSNFLTLSFISVFVVTLISLIIGLIMR